MVINMNKIMLSVVFTLILFSNMCFAENFILPTHDEIIDNLNWYDKITYNSKDISFSIITEPDKWVCTEQPTSVGTFIVPDSLGYTVNCGGDSLINLYLYVSETEYRYIREDISPHYYEFGSSVLGNRYVVECYSCTEYVPVDPCEGVMCPDYCDDTTNYYNGYCFDGICKYSKKINSEKCGYIIPDICEGVECRDYCDGTTLKNYGECDSNTGKCEYTLIPESTVCGYVPIVPTPPVDLCEKVKCLEYCDGTTLYYNGHCFDRLCIYETTLDSELCIHEKVDWISYGIAGFVIIIMMLIMIFIIIKKR